MLKNKREFEYSAISNKVVKMLNRLVALMEDDLIIKLAEQNIPQQDIRKILGVDMHQITNLLKFIKKSKKKGG